MQCLLVLLNKKRNKKKSRTNQLVLDTSPTFQAEKPQIVQAVDLPVGLP